MQHTGEHQKWCNLASFPRIEEPETDTVDHLGVLNKEVIVDSQPNFADEKSSFNLLGKIENTVSSSEEPKENFQANDDIVGAAVYQYGDNIVVEFEGKYWLYEHYHNTDFDGNSD